MIMNRKMIELIVMNAGTYALADVIARNICRLFGIPFSVWVPVVLTVGTVSMLFILKGSKL